MSPMETHVLDQPSKDTEKSAPGWRFLKLLGYREAPGAGAGKHKTGSRTPKEPEERKHQFATWYIFAAFLGVMLVQSLWLRFTQVDNHSIQPIRAAPRREQDRGGAGRTGDHSGNPEGAIPGRP